MRNPASEDGNRRPRGRRLGPAARIVVGLLLAAVAGFVGLSWSSDSALRSHPGFAGFSTTDTTVIRFELGGHRYAVPANYLDLPPVGRTKTHDATLIRTLWPSLEGRTKENYDRFRVKDHGQIVSILLTTYDRFPVTAAEGVRIMLNIKKKGSAPLEARAPVDGLERLVPVGGYTMIGRYEILVERRDSEITSFLACRPHGAVPYPSCSHWFALNDEIQAKVTYGKPYFPEWRQIRERVTALLAGFEADPKPAPPAANTN